jgi:hypothetical protein
LRRLAVVATLLLVCLALLGADAEAQTSPGPTQIAANDLPPVPVRSAADVKRAETLAAPTETLVAPTTRLQAIVDDVRARLAISEEVVVSIVPRNKLLVSVQRSQSRDGVFALSFESDFLDVLSKDELIAVVAHELGHVWIFTHHPYLQTEELANQVAMRLVSRATLDNVYEKVWQRTGVTGDLVYLPPK